MHWSVFIVLSFIGATYSARILAIIPTPSYSHQIVFRPLWKELSLRGHQIVLLTTNPMNNSELTNLTEIDLSANYRIFETIYVQNMLKEARKQLFISFDKGITSLLKVGTAALRNIHVKNLINNKSEHFDVVLSELIHRAPFAFSKRFNCPLIGILSFDATVYYHNLMGNPAHPILQPDTFFPFDNIEMTFLERAFSVIVNLFFRILPSFPLVYNYEKSIVEDCFPNVTSDLDELSQEMSMLFLNINPIFWGIRPVNPNTIMFGGGIHFEEPKPLPEDLNNFLNSNPEGVIYFSLGTNVFSTLLEVPFRKVIIETIKSLPYKVLWKYESDILENKPDNLIISKWFPQQDILRHPNIKLFITQGGLQSIEEAIHNKIPMVVIPFFGDQPANAYRVEEKGLGLSLDHQTLTKEEFRNAIFEVIKNEKYRKTSEEISKFIKDEPMTGLEKLVWWTEYVIRNKGAKYFKNPGANLPLYQYLMLDVIGFFVILVLIIFLFIIFIFRQIKNCVCRKRLKNKIE